MQLLTQQQIQNVSGGVLPVVYAYFSYITAITTLVDGASAFADGFNDTWNERKAADAKKESNK